MNYFGIRLKHLRTQDGLTQQDLADALGISKSTISMYENGNREPDFETLENIADYFNIDMATLFLSTSTSLPSPDIAEDTIQFPVLVNVAAGYDQPAQVLQNWEGEKIEVPRAYLHGRSPDDYFAMRVVGDSMYPDYQNGDILLILRQSILNRSGEVAVILYGGEDATLKKIEFVQGEDWMKLLPINPQYPPRMISGADLEQCRILGIPKVLIRNIK